MPYALSQPLNASGHQDVAVRGNYSKKVSTELTRPVAVEKSPELKTVPERRFQLNKTTLSFAYDAVGKSLNIVMTDKASGEVVRKISYKQISPDLHKTNTLQGLLLDQLV